MATDTQKFSSILENRNTFQELGNLGMIEGDAGIVAALLGNSGKSKSEILREVEDVRAMVRQAAARKESISNLPLNSRLRELAQVLYTWEVAANGNDVNERVSKTYAEEKQEEKEKREKEEEAYEDNIGKEEIVAVRVRRKDGRGYDTRYFKSCVKEGKRVVLGEITDKDEVEKCRKNGKKFHEVDSLEDAKTLGIDDEGMVRIGMKDKSSKATNPQDISPDTDFASHNKDRLHLPRNKPSRANARTAQE